MDFAKFYCHDEISDVPVAPSGTTGTLDSFGSTYMTAGFYRFSTCPTVYDCRRAGLYRFKVSGEPFFRNRIVIGSPVDLYALLSGVSWNHIHGVADEGVDYQTMSNRGRFAKWRLRCGVIAGMMAWLLPQVGFTARVANVSTTGPLNGFDDGHIVLEVSHNGQWRMFDMTNGCYWKDSNGNHLSTAQFIAHIANNGPMPEKVKLDGTDRRWDNETTTVSGGVLDLGLYAENFLGTPAQEEAWNRRIFQSVTYS